MLKEIVFVLEKDNASDEQILSHIDGAVSYIKSCGYGAEYTTTVGEGGSKTETLLVTDSGVLAEDLLNQGYYVIGMEHEKNRGEVFKSTKYIFTDIDEVDIDSFVKAYQRYSGEPWEVIRTERLLIRETTLDDVDEFYKLYKDPEMTRYMEGLFENPEDEKRYQRDYIEKVYGLMGFGIWTLVRLEDNRVIGRAGYSIRNGFDEIELGFLVGKEFQRKGYALEACRAILDYGRDVLQLQSVQTLVKAENEVSIHICEKLGFSTIDKVRVEENIYGREYNIGVSVPFNQTQFGEYVRMIKNFYGNF